MSRVGYVCIHIHIYITIIIIMMNVIIVIIVVAIIFCMGGAKALSASWAKS